MKYEPPEMIFKNLLIPNSRMKRRRMTILQQSGNWYGPYFIQITRMERFECKKMKISTTQRLSIKFSFSHETNGFCCIEMFQVLLQFIHISNAQKNLDTFHLISLHCVFVHFINTLEMSS